MVPRRTNAGNYSRTTTQRPSTSTTALPVRISSFGNGTPETSNPIHRQKQQPPYSVGSRLFPLTRRVANESSPFGLGISHQTLLLPTSFRPFPTRQNNSAAPPPSTRSVSTEDLCPSLLYCHPGAPAESLSRSPPRRVTTDPPCSGLRRPSGERNRPPAHGLVSSHLDKVWTPYRPLFTDTLAQTIPPIPGPQRYLPANFSVYPLACPGFSNHNKLTDHRSRTSSSATPPLTGSLPPTALQLSLTTQPRTTPTDYVSVASEHRTVSLQPNGREPSSDTNTTTPLLPQQPCRFTT